MISGLFVNGLGGKLATLKSGFDRIGGRHRRNGIDLVAKDFRIVLRAPRGASTSPSLTSAAPAVSAKYAASPTWRHSAVHGRPATRSAAPRSYRAHARIRPHTQSLPPGGDRDTHRARKRRGCHSRRPRPRHRDQPGHADRICPDGPITPTAIPANTRPLVSQPPRLKPPPGATDCHIHVYLPGFARQAGGPPIAELATVADYLQVQQRLGMARVVVTQSNACQFNGRDIERYLAALKAIETRYVINHFGGFMPRVPADDRRVDEMLRLVDRRNAWFKLAGSYEVSEAARPVMATWPPLRDGSSPMRPSASSGGPTGRTWACRVHNTPMTQSCSISCWTGRAPPNGRRYPWTTRANSTISEAGGLLSAKRSGRPAGPAWRVPAWRRNGGPTPAEGP